MIFRRKTPAEPFSGNGSNLRGRDGAGGRETGGNPLARRLMQDDEPDTIDLADVGGFTGPEAEEPETRRNVGEAGGGKEGAPAGHFSVHHPVFTRDPRSGKFYVHPVEGEETVWLGDEAVVAPTELRRGDRIRIGTVIFEYLS